MQMRQSYEFGMAVLVVSSMLALIAAAVAVAEMEGVVFSVVVVVCVMMVYIAV